MFLILAILALVVIFFLFIVFRGPVFVPSINRDLDKLFTNLVDPKKEEFLVDLGSGDGRVLRRFIDFGGKSALGIEANPFLVLFSFLKSLKYGGKVKHKLADYMIAEIPKNTKVFYLFIAKPYVKSFEKRIIKFVNENNHPVKVISYGITLKQAKLIDSYGAHYLYEVMPQRNIK